MDMIRRTALKQLDFWRHKSDRKPLVLRGARQVGKTTLVNEFAKTFDNYLYVNLEDSRFAKLFDTDQSTADILDAIFVFLNKPKKKGDTLLFIDEIQNSPQAVARLRFFYEQLPEIYVVAAGSLLESLIDRHISFPVGRVEYMAVRPLTFIEFLYAFEEDMLAEMIQQTSLSPILHQRAIEYFNRYALVGGMPEIVSKYARDNDLIALKTNYDSLIVGYRDDVEKYASNKSQVEVVRFILNEGWGYAAQTITLGGFANSNYRSREIGEAFRTLEKTMLLELTYPSSSFVPPISVNQKRSPKLFWLDTGLVNYVAGVQREFFGTKDIADAWRGKIAEQIVAQEILATDSSVAHRRYFWSRDKKGSDAELDFVILHDGVVVPIEVKSGHNARLKSLHMFVDSSPVNIGIRIWSNPFSVDDVTTQSGKKFRLLNVPFYYVGQIHEILNKYLN